MLDPAEILTEVDAVLGRSDTYPLEAIPGFVAELRQRAESAEDEVARFLEAQAEHERVCMGEMEEN